MLFNYLRIAYRNLLKNPIFSYINIFGLAVGMAAFLFIAQYIRFERSYEDFNEHGDNIMRLTTEFYNGDAFAAADCETFAPLGPLVKERMPEVVDFARMYGIDGLTSMRAGENNFLESKLYWADASVFNVFTYKVIDGDLSKALRAQFEVVLTESLAKKYFGRTNVTNENIEIADLTYQIKAVIADVPANTHLKFSALLSRVSFKTVKPWYPDDLWNNNNEYCYIRTVPGIDLTAFNKKLADLTRTEISKKVEGTKFKAEWIKDIHLHSNKPYEPEPTGNAKVVYYFTLIALFVIVIAWVNYINMSTARAVERGREVGIRKVMGSMKRQLIWQFLSESLVVNIIAGLIALFLFQISFPLLRDLSGLPLSLDIKNDPVFWMSFAALVGVGSLLSGIYPAFVLSSFNPVSVLKGKFQGSSHGRHLRKALVIFQFSATVVLIISLCTVYLQVKFLRSYDLGMNIDQTIALTGGQINVPDSLVRSSTQALKTELLKNPQVKSVARAGSLPGVNLQELSTSSFSRIGEASGTGHGYMYSYLGIDADFVSTMKMSFVSGRNFENGSPNHDVVIVNEEAARLLGYENADQAIGSKITFRTRGSAEGSTIIGVLKNFHFRSPKDGHLPMLFYYDEPSDYFAINVSSTEMQTTLTSLQQSWNKVYPNTVFNYFFLNERYDQQYRADMQFGKIMAAFAVLIVFIACLGLFGLSSYTITQRTKEIGIRKVLGASVTGIVKLLTVDFVRTVLIAAVIAMPVAYFAMEEWLSGYAVRIDLSVWVFIIAIVAILFIAMITVSIQTIRSAIANPTDSLKQE
jgi:putative ABC transport system permease protein